MQVPTITHNEYKDNLVLLSSPLQDQFEVSTKYINVFSLWLVHFSILSKIVFFLRIHLVSFLHNCKEGGIFCKAASHWSSWYFQMSLYQALSN